MDIGLGRPIPSSSGAMVVGWGRGLAIALPPEGHSWCSSAAPTPGGGLPFGWFVTIPAITDNLGRE
jgi:hypothetical protein